LIVSLSLSMYNRIRSPGGMNPHAILCQASSSLSFVQLKLFARLDREGYEQNAFGRCRAAAVANCLRGLHLIRDRLSSL